MITKSSSFSIVPHYFSQSFFIDVLCKSVDAPTEITYVLGLLLHILRTPVNRHELVECKKARGEKAMAWVGIIDGRCLPVVWFDVSVNGDVYLE